MPRVDAIPVVQGMERDEIAQRLQHGWILVGRQTVRQGIIADPKLPPMYDVDIWMLPEPMMPAGMVAQLLVQLFRDKRDGTLLDDIARALLGVGIIPLAEQFSAAEENAAQEDTSGPV